MLSDLTPELMSAAWERVLENSGGPGVDGVTVERFTTQAAAGLPELLSQALDGTYRPLPLRKIVVEKKPGSNQGRELLVPCVRDRILQTAMARLLSRSFEEEFLEISFAYRPGRGVDRAVARILQLRDRGWLHVVDADITSYFTEISHKLLEERLGADPAIDEPAMVLLRRWIRADIWDGHEVRKLRRGISQGSPLSPLLANFFLTPLDEALGAGNHKLIRYADDFLVLCQTAEGAREALACTENALRRLGLTLNTKKTRLTGFEQGFQFLGVRFGMGEALIPWKARRGAGRVLYLAHTMPGRLLREYRKQHAAAPEDAHPAPKKRQGKRAVEAGEQSKEAVTDVAFLYVTQQGAVVRKSGDRFLVEHDGQIILDVPYHRLEHILIFGNVQITSQAAAEALDHRVPTSLFSRQGRFRGALTPPAGKNVLLRLAQYGLRQNADACVAASRETIRWKIENSLRVLERYEDRDTATDETMDHRRTMEDAQAGLESAKTIPEVEGLEGAAARRYFEALMRFNKSGFEWPGREKHPARDPLNALLSLTYTLLMQELSALGEAAGLDPAIGFLHDVDGSRPSLALDLMEPLRAPVADRFVLGFVNRGQVSPEDFEKRDDHGGVLLKPEAMRRYFEAYERWMLTPVERTADGNGVHFRGIVRREVRNFAEWVRAGAGPAAAWQPFAFAGAEIQ